MRRWIKLVFVAGLALLAACGTPEQVDPAKVASEGATAFDAVTAFHFTLDVTQGEAAPLGDIILINADGDAVRPDKVKAKLKAKLTGAPLAVNINGIIIGADAWITPNPFSPTAFEKLADTAGLSAFSPAKGVSDVLRGLRSPVFVAREDVNGTAVYHIKGVADTAALNALTGGAATAGEVALDLWIGVDDKLLRKMTAVGPLDPAEPAGITRTLVLTEFNKTLEIAPPQ